MLGYFWGSIELRLFLMNLSVGQSFETNKTSQPNYSYINSNCLYHLKEWKLDKIMFKKLFSKIFLLWSWFFYSSVADPKKWSVEDVRGWLLWNSRQHNLPISIDLFNITGATLASMNEQDFQQRAPQVCFKRNSFQPPITAEIRTMLHNFIFSPAWTRTLCL